MKKFDKLYVLEGNFFTGIERWHMMFWVLSTRWKKVWRDWNVQGIEELKVVLKLVVGFQMMIRFVFKSALMWNTLEVRYEALNRIYTFWCKSFIFYVWNYYLPLFVFVTDKIPLCWCKLHWALCQPSHNGTECSGWKICTMKNISSSASYNLKME